IRKRRTIRGCPRRLRKRALRWAIATRPSPGSIGSCTIRIWASFNVQSYDRQLREIWGGDPASAGLRCADRLARIIARHIIRTQAQFTISTSAILALKNALDELAKDEVLEKNFLGERTFSVANVRDVLAACSSIGCLTNKTGARLGTGFLIAGEWLG